MSDQSGIRSGSLGATMTAAVNHGGLMLEDHHGMLLLFRLDAHLADRGHLFALIFTFCTVGSSAILRH